MGQTIMRTRVITKSYLDEENNNGIWIRITRLTKIKKEIINRLVLANGEKPVLDVINKTMTSFMFVKNHG